MLFDHSRIFSKQLDTTLTKQEGGLTAQGHTILDDITFLFFLLS